ncbi:MAG TPA: M20 aminoacylase family protein [Rhodocyclaceae bacterium]|nr:M20 aminoacylase family protein [Rhodocyclaceae bacterium]
MSIIAEIAERTAALAAIRRDIHAHPELAFTEHRTADVVARELERLGIETHRGVGKTGVVGVLRGRASSGTPRMIGLRADMDALPIQEHNEFVHRSQHAGCMHACGHDGHTTMLLGAAQYLAATRNFAGTAVFVFQPAEEGLGGAAAMIRDGLFERFPVDAIFGMHNWPGMPIGRFGVAAGPVMASADRFDIVINGHGAHAAMPHQGIDPIVAGAQLVQSAQTIASRTTDPLDAVVVSVTQFHAGEAYNAISQKAVLCGTIRALTHQVRRDTQAALRRIAAGIAQAHGVQIEVSFVEGEPPTVNTNAEAEFCRRVAIEMVGTEHVDWGHRPSMGAEDFAHFLERRPGCYVWIGNGGEAGGCMLHSARYDFNDEILPLGASYWVRLVERYLPIA